MSSIPMPSPRGTNHERAFMPNDSRVTAAFDAEPDDGGEVDYSALLSFLEEKLGGDDFRTVRRMLGFENPDLDGASDAARRNAYARTALDLHRRGHITRQEMERRIVSGPYREPTAADRARFKEMFPNADRLKIL